MIRNSILINLYSVKYIDHLTLKINLLNKNDKSYLYLFLNTRFIIGLIILITFVFVLPINIFITLIILLVNHYFFEYFLINRKIQKREKELYIEGREFFDMLVVFLDANYTLNKAIELASNSYDNIISNLFKEVLTSIDKGRNTKDALKQISTKIPGKFNQKMIFYLIEYYENQINDTSKLNLIIEQETKLDMLRIKNKVNLLPIKLMLATVFIFVPAMLGLIYFDKILDLLIK